MCFSGVGRENIYGRQNQREGYRGRGDEGMSNSSVWSAAQLEAAKDVPACPSIDWDTIRKNKEKYEELKWKGDSSVLCYLLLNYTYYNSQSKF